MQSVKEENSYIGFFFTKSGVHITEDLFGDNISC